MQLRSALRNVRCLSTQTLSNNARNETAKGATDHIFTFDATRSTLPTNLTIATTGMVAPASSIVWKIPAGSRFENADTSGHSHYLRHALFAGNRKESGLALARKTELRGATLRFANNRHSVTISAEFPHEEASNIVESISCMLQDFHLEKHQMDDIEQRVALDREIIAADAKALLWEKGFEAMYRAGLGNAIISAASSPVSPDSLKAFLHEALKRGGNIVSSSGLDHLELSEIVQLKYRQGVGKLHPPLSDAAKIYGGERRIEFGGDRNHVLIAFGTGGLASASDNYAAHILSALFGLSQAVQYGTRLSHFPSLRELQERWPLTSISTKVNQSIDGGLFGIFISAPKGVELKPAIESICREIKAIIGSSNSFISSDSLNAAKQRAAFNISSILDSRLELADVLADHVLARDAPLNLREEIAHLHSLSTNEFKAQAVRILSRKPAFISMGDLRSLPYADEISF